MRNRNIKLNVFLNEREHDLLIEKTNKARLTQSDFIRKLINDYKYEYIDFDSTMTLIFDGRRRTSTVCESVGFDKPGVYILLKGRG